MRLFSDLVGLEWRRRDAPEFASRFAETLESRSTQRLLFTGPEMKLAIVVKGVATLLWHRIFRMKWSGVVDWSGRALSTLTMEASKNL